MKEYKGPNIVSLTELSKDYEMLLEEYNLMKKEYEHDRNKLKAFEIIKEKRVDCWALFYRLDKSYEVLTNEDFDYISPYKLNKEEFDLLKEVLK